MRFFVLLALSGWLAGSALPPIPAAAAPVALASQSEALLADGPYAVAEAEQVVLFDRERGKELPVYVAYPQQPGRYPVIVFSHGSGGSGKEKALIARFWASHGYVCLNPTHADSIALQRATGQAQTGGLLQSAKRLANDPGAWQNRARDISFVISSLGELERQIPDLKGKPEARNIGVSGHSLGAFTAMLIGGARIDIPGGGRAASFADNRVRAILLLSAQGSGQQGLTERSWEAMNRPTMTVTGSLDRGITGQGPQEKLEPFTLAPRGDKYGLLIEGANHGSYTGRFAGQGAEQEPQAGRLGNLPPQMRERLRERFRAGEGEGGGRMGGGMRARGGADQTAIFGYVKVATTAFWDAYLKGDERARAYLQSDGLVKFSNGAVDLRRK
ncbi:alpha/beta hydrolase family protein [Gloeobacter morelensis]|uniref:Chlorophyllase n=1 Tax=Gloeobacter morelensis MG652769 TaxID=2781736 RepID=A0ABY3PGJ7_9CYAN|nr:hypothetical protein [Gloeobacter morelensis]UFP92765.1 hypothetical protein ISF26_13085 [Gloeobacter morelensis MG652769]